MAIEAKRVARLDRIRTGVDGLLFAIVRLLGLFLLVCFLRRRDHFQLGRVLRLRDDIRSVRIDEADDHIHQARLAGLDRLVGAQQKIIRGRIHRERAPYRIQALLDALGDADLALARQQFHRAHLAHVHAHRIGGAAELGVERRQRRGGLFDRLLVRGRGGLGGEQRLGIRCLLVHRNAHVVDGVDDVFDLLRIDDLGRQMIIHLCVREVALLLAARNQQLQLRLAILGHGRHAPLDAERTLIGCVLAACGARLARGGTLRVRRCRASSGRTLLRHRRDTQARRRGDRLLGGGRFHGLGGLVCGALFMGRWGLVLTCHVVAA